MPEKQRDAVTSETERVEQEVPPVRVLVLCQRTRLTEGEVDESLVRRTLANQRLQALAAQALAEARARARIVPPDAG